MYRYENDIMLIFTYLPHPKMVLYIYKIMHNKVIKKIKIKIMYSVHFREGADSPGSSG